MRVALLNTFMPYIRGGAEILVDDLAAQLKMAGHEVELFRLPFPQSFDSRLCATIEAAHLLCFDEFDRVITFKFPAYCIKHHSKVIWLFHQFRQVYDLWGEEYGFQPGLAEENLRRIIKSVDDTDIPTARRIFTNSLEVSRRLKKFNNIDSTVLMPPLQNYEDYHFEEIGDFIFYPSRITPLKRQHLAIEAMQYVKSNVRLVITGVCEEQHYFEQLKSLIQTHSLEDRVILRNQWITDEEKKRLFAISLAGMYIPFKEDSCGFVSMEALYSAKPVITCTDSGGTSEIIEDQVNGYIVPPEAARIAERIDQLYLDRELAKRMGNVGREDILHRDITWSNTIRRLLA